MGDARAATVIVLLSMVSCLPVAAQNRLVAEIPIELAYNKTVIPVTVGDSALRLILDTGMPYDGVLVFGTDRVDVSRFPNLVRAQIAGAGQGSASGALHDPTAGFSIGALRFDAHPVTILTTDAFKGFPTDGVIGYSLLGHYAVELDHDLGVMRLYEPATFAAGSEWASVDTYFKGNQVPWVDFRVSTAGEPAVRLAAYVDCASGEALELLDREVDAFRAPATTGERLLGRGLSGDIYGKDGRLARVEIGPFTLEDVAATVTPAAVRSKQEGADAVIGNNVLRRFDLIWDYAHAKLHLRPNRDHREPFR